MLAGPADLDSEIQGEDQEIICILQLKFLKDKAVVRELTMEEVKKTEILVKALDLIRRGKPKDDEAEGVKSIGTEDLMNFMDEVAKGSSKKQ